MFHELRSKVWLLMAGYTRQQIYLSHANHAEQLKISF